jgi:hypothetical protein
MNAEPGPASAASANAAVNTSSTDCPAKTQRTSAAATAAGWRTRSDTRTSLRRGESGRLICLYGEVC